MSSEDANPANKNVWIHGRFRDGAQYCSLPSLIFQVPNSIGIGLEIIGSAANGGAGP